ncbi:glycoside hydrolase family 3 C-terminal domain-containing protein [Mucilaginibacter sabulilitoris]|uniref:Glycoside hydrolase family 3 C-terminal domain-containing protein n=1 Tax=Mucilaginibacter sabulilitoris TaxID=1173583 RepID=A0ABZ0TT08_9SPHI|nr:glycoside hydrolase family 3 C-terminal domain-containing protein [Mucilaginibacter sabulilitoris]WPU94909.1 glycoside hydrolase family 3 C-terminal domain-containing protein [Mucilaginibacter sabulilitoris]
MRISYKLNVAIVLMCSAVSFQSTVHAQGKQQAPQLRANNVKQIIAALTLEEKSKLVVGMGFKMPGMPPPEKGKKPEAIDIGGFKLPPSDPDAYNIPEKVPGAAGRTHGIARLGIPSMTVSDGPAGLRIEPVRNGDKSKTYYATAFPVATLLASSWDTELVNRVGVAFGNEVREYGVDILLAPGLNIHRNPLGGRNFEYYSEDPLVAGDMTAAIVRGIQSNGVGTSIKHYAANNQETNRNSINTVVSERAMRELYLRGFEIAVKKSQPWTVMSSYNKLNGTFTSQRHDLLTTILKKEWGLKGFVMTDWFGGVDPVAQMKAGNDLIMPGSPSQSEAIVAAVKKGTLSIAQLNANVERILNIIIKSPSFTKYKYSDKPDLTGHAKVAREAAAQGMVLLKNDDHALPLAAAKRVAVFGNTSYNIIAGGTGSGDVNKAYTISLMQGLENASYKLQEKLSKSYTDYLADMKLKQPKPKNFFDHPAPIPEKDITDIIADEANDADAALITIGRNAGEGADRKLDNDYYLSAAEKAMIKTIADAFHAKGKKVIVVLNIGGVIEVTSWRDGVDGILLAWQPGLEAGNAIADVLSGKVNPSGKLATTFPVDYKDVPSANNFPGTPEDKPEKVVYEEGIYVGYRYYDAAKIKPAYEFGYGLSYTSFTFSNLKLSAPNFVGSITATVTVKNTGDVAGKEVVQLYLAAPKKDLDKPEDELKAFGKTKLLAPGQSQTMSFVIKAADLASFYTSKESWIADAGKYEVKIGSSSRTIAEAASFKLAKDITVEKVNKALVPEQAINELKLK